MRSIEFTVKGVDGDNTDVWDRDHRLHTFKVNELILVRKEER
jgi:hypothetical protein